MALAGLGKTAVVATLLTAATSSQGLLTTASKRGGHYRYNTATVPLLAEGLKFLISSGILRHQVAQRSASVQVTRGFRASLPFLIPSIIYWLHNNVQFVTLKYLDPATYQVLGNLKIVTTGILFWLLLRRRLSVLQWLALALLMTGAMTSQVNPESQSSSSFAAPSQGYALAGISALLSALAAVYTEWALKRNADSLYWQNMQLYSWGFACNAAGLTINDLRQGGDVHGLWITRIWTGYDWVTWLVVLNLACSGLLVSWIMKHTDSIVKVYATSMAMLLTTAASVPLFGLSPSLQLYLGIITSSVSLALYYLPPSVLLANQPSPLRAAWNKDSTGSRVSLLPVTEQQARQS